MTNIVLNKQATASNSFAPFLPSRAVDGVSTPASRWVSSLLPAWLSVDLQTYYWINQWIVNSLGSVGWQSTYNLCDFKLQGSTDNANWFDMDSVTNNSANQINRTTTPKLVRYLRVYITKGLRCNNQVSSIVDFQAFESANAPFLGTLVSSTGSLVPGFNSRKFVYSMSVDNTTSSITFTPSALQSNMVIKVNNTVVTSGQPSQAISLNVGNNPVTIEVTSVDNLMKTTYTVNVTRESVASYLSSLVITDDSDDTVNYNPPFVKTTFNYTATVNRSVASVTIRPLAEDSNAVVKVNGVVVPRNQSSNPITLNTGTNTITVLVNSTSYTIVITKQA